MIDPAVERQFADTTELLGLWNKFHEFFLIGVKNQSITPDKENQFLELKSRIAMLHDSFMEALTDNHSVGQDVLNVVTRSITLKHLGKQSSADTKKMEIEWHEGYMLINDTIGALDEKRRELANINETQFKAQKAAGVAKQKVGKFLSSFYFKLAVILAIVLGGTIGVQVTGIYDYDELGKISALKAPYQTGKWIVRKVWNPESPWPTIESSYRKPYSGWPGGLKTPEVIGSTKDDALNTLRQTLKAAPVYNAMKPSLDQAKEARVEKTEKQFEGDIRIYSFLFPNSTQANAVVKAWEDINSKYSEETSPQRVYNVRVIKDVNLVVLLSAGKQETVDSMKDTIYGAK